MILTPSSCSSLASHSSNSPFNRYPYLQKITSVFQLSNYSIISSPTSNPFQLRHPIKAMAQTNSSCSSAVSATGRVMNSLLFVEMGVGYDQHGQDITAAAMRACRDATSSNSIPAFRRGSIPGVSFEQMKLQIKLGVPQSLQQHLDIEKIKSVFPYGEIVKVEVVDGGLICSSGVHVEEMGDKNDDCYIVNAAVYVGY